MYIQRRASEIYISAYATVCLDKMDASITVFSEGAHGDAHTSLLQECLRLETSTCIHREWFQIECDAYGAINL